jgi:two-component system sensor histidine kinase FlrB
MTDKQPSAATAPLPSANELAGAFDLFVQASQALERQHASLTLKVDALSADLVKANARLNTLLDALPAAVILVEDGQITHFNPAARQLVPGLQTQVAWALPPDWVAGEGPNEYHFQSEDQRKTVQLQQIVHPEGSVIQIQDITDNLRMLEESERVDRLAAMGKMSAGIAHQLRTPLSTALLYASHLCNPDLDKLDQLDFANRLQSQLLNLNKLAGNMLQFIRARPQKMQVMSLDELIQEACDSLEALQQQRQIALALDLQAQGCQVSVEKASIVAALVGIMENALQVCSPGQRIRVSTQSDHLRAVITIEDNGPGIDPQMMESLFDPFATNRTSGTGLGLAIARNAIRSHRGDISARNLPQGGACFTVALPCMASL